MRTLIHIGQHKTATTSIQNSLVKNHNLLLSEGLWYPLELAGSRFPSHYPLNVYCLDKNRFSHKKAKLLKNNKKSELKHISKELKYDIKTQYVLADTNGCDTVLWSNEGLYLLNSIHEYQKLYELFSPYSEEIIVVCCFREVESFMKSYKEQMYKSGFTPVNDSDSFCYIEPDSWLFNYKRKRFLLQEVFKENCLFFSYSENVMVEKFLNKIGYSNLVLEELLLNQSHVKI